MTAPLKFLVVDPLSGVQSFARQMLQSQGFSAANILCCADTDCALAQGLIFKPDFLITDWFPKAPLTGLNLFQRLKEARPGLHLSLLSFEISPQHALVAAAHGAHFLLKKPFTAEELKAQMARALDALAKNSPALHGPVRDVMRQVRKIRPLPRMPLPATPPQPVIKPGDSVRYKGKRHVAQYIVHRTGGTVVQLKGVPALIPLHELQPG